MKRLSRLCLLLCFSFAVNTAFAAADDLSQLRPVLAPLPPSFWNRYGWPLVIVAALVLGALAFWITRARRSQLSATHSPENRARAALAAWQGRPEDLALVAGVSRILKEYVIAALDLPPGELTTAELRQTLAACPRVNASLAAAVSDFLKQCDVRKFAPAPPAPETSVVTTALNLIAQIENHRQQALQVVPPQTPPAIAASPAA